MIGVYRHVCWKVVFIITKVSVESYTHKRGVHIGEEPVLYI